MFDLGATHASKGERSRSLATTNSPSFDNGHVRSRSATEILRKELVGLSVEACASDSVCCSRARRFLQVGGMRGSLER